MIKWLKLHHICSIAMESTGNYWQTLFDALQRAGFEVLLVNGNQIKNVKGKKTDVLDCLWIQKLHSLGLLNGSFLPAADIQSLRMQNISNPPVRRRLVVPGHFTFYPNRS